MATITKAQTKKLRTVASIRFGGCDCRRPSGSSPGYACDYHRWLQEGFGVASTRDLSATQAARAIDRLEGKKTQKARRAKDASAGRYPVPDAPEMVTQAQADEIARVEERLRWSVPPPDLCREGHTSPQLQKMIRRQLGRPASIHTPVRGLANRQASTLITGLRRLLTHNRERA